MIDVLDKWIERVAVLVFATSFLFICINVANRYLVLGLFRDIAKQYEGLRPAYHAVSDALGSITATAGEVPGLLLVWIAFLGAYLAMRGEGHIAFDMLVSRLSARWQKCLAMANTLLMSGFLLMLLWQSLRMIWVSGGTEIETAEIAQGWFMLIMPLAAILLLLAILVQQYRLNRDDTESAAKGDY